MLSRKRDNSPQYLICIRKEHNDPGNGDVHGGPGSLTPTQSNLVIFKLDRTILKRLVVYSIHFKKVFINSSLYSDYDYGLGAAFTVARVEAGYFPKSGKERFHP